MISSITFSFDGVQIKSQFNISELEKCYKRSIEDYFISLKEMDLFPNVDVVHFYGTFDDVTRLFHPIGIKVNGEAPNDNLNTHLIEKFLKIMTA